MKVKLLVPIFLLAVLPAAATPIQFSEDQLLAVFRGEGMIRLDSIGLWNGMPVSESNRPTDYQRTLAATVRFYSDSTAKNQLFVQVDDVISTHFGYALGLAFVNTALTGIDMEIRSDGESLGPAVLSTQYANPGQRLLGPIGKTATNTTPGWRLQRSGQAHYTLKTPGFTDYRGFGEWNWVLGSQRIAGGGVFLLTFGSQADVSQIDWEEAAMSLVWGIDNQRIWAQYVSDRDLSEVAEPGTAWLLCGAAGCLWAGRRRRSDGLQ